MFSWLGHTFTCRNSKKLRHYLIKTRLGWCEYQHGPKQDLFKHMCNHTRTCAYMGHNPLHTVLQVKSNGINESSCSLNCLEKRLMCWISIFFYGRPSLFADSLSTFLTVLGFLIDTKFWCPRIIPSITAAFTKYYYKISPK